MYISTEQTLLKYKDGPTLHISVVLNQGPSVH